MHARKDLGGKSVTKCISLGASSCDIRDSGLSRSSGGPKPLNFYAFVWVICSSPLVLPPPPPPPLPLPPQSLKQGQGKGREGKGKGEKEEIGQERESLNGTKRETRQLVYESPKQYHLFHCDYVPTGGRNASPREATRGAAWVLAWAYWIIGK